MADVIDNYVNITITITAEGVATISCSNCVGSVVLGGTYTVNYTVTNNSANQDVLFAKLYSIPGMTGGNMEQELWRGTLAGGASTPQSVAFVNVQAAISKSIRVGHEAI